jgi:hypothetical protein
MVWVYGGLELWLLRRRHGWACSATFRGLVSIGINTTWFRLWLISIHANSRITLWGRLGVVIRHNLVSYHGFLGGGLTSTFV